MRATTRETSAEPCQIPGWRCVHCNSMWLKEDIARQCCGELNVCSRCNLERVHTKWAIRCKGCQEKVDAERYAALPVAIWDGKAPLGVWDDDRILFDTDSLAEYLVDAEDAGTEVRLLICRRIPPPWPEWADTHYDLLPRDFELDDEWLEAEAQAAELLAKVWPDVWETIDVRPDEASMRMILGDVEEPKS